jgi:hypothetical protein
VHDALDTLVNTIHHATLADSPAVECQQTRLYAIGARHRFLREFGFTGDLIEEMGEHMVETVCSNEAISAYPEAKRAWMQLIAIIIDRLRAGNYCSSRSDAYNSIMCIYRLRIWSIACTAFFTHTPNEEL